MKIYDSVSDLVGRTPTVRLSNLTESLSLEAEILAKIEYFNPTGSAKDRVARQMLDDYEKSGKLRRGDTVIEPTSGNTGIGLAAIAASRGYKAVIVMPDTMSKERQLLMKAYGAELVLTDGALGMKGAIAKAEELSAAIPGSVIAGQFTNPSNPLAHYLTTGPELWEDCGGELDILVATVGTGGTLSGSAKYIKEKKPDVKVIAVEPDSSPYLSRGVVGAHKIQGIGAGFVPDTLDTSIYDEVITVTDDAAYATARDIARLEGLLVGISSGAALSAAIEVAQREDSHGKRIAVILPDTGERYLSSGLFD